MRRVIPVALAVFGVFSIFVLNLRATPIAHAVALNTTVNFQARLQTAVGGIVPDDSYNVEFKLYAASSGGSPLWTETYLNSEDEGLSTVNGYLSTSLGSIEPFGGSINWDQQLYITMNIGGVGSEPDWDGEMDPRMQLTAVPYAFQAGELAKSNADGSLTSSLSIQAPTIGNQNFVIQDQGAAGTYNLLTEDDADANYIQLQGSTPGTPQTGHINIDGTAKVGDLQVATGGDVSIDNGALIISGTGTVDYTSPLSAAMHTKINIPSYDPGAGSQIIALGVTSAANSTASVLKVLDARSSAHTPSIAVMSPDETKSFGLSWDGSNSTAVIKTSSNSVALQSNGLNVLTGTNSSGASVINIGVASSSDGKLQISNAASANTVTVQATSVSGSYTIQLPSAIGSATQCLAVSSVVGSVETLGHTSCGGSPTLQNAYTNSNSSPNILLDSTGHGITIQDASTTVGGNLFAIQNYATTTKYLSVSTTAVGVVGALNVTGAGLLQTDSATALAVKNAAGTVTTFDVDTNNSRVGIGTDTPTRTLDVAINTSSTNTLPLLLRQAGSGDVGFELQAAGKSFYQGVDATDGSFKISSSASAAGTFTVGTTGDGVAVPDFNANYTQAMKVTASASGTLSSMSIKITQLDGNVNNRLIQLGVYSDNGSGTAPSTLLASTSAQTATVGLNTISMSGISITSGTIYWLALSENGQTRFSRNTSGGTTAYMSSAYPIPSTFTVNDGTSSDNITIYMTVISSGSSDNFSGTNLFTLTETGSAKIQTSTNSAVALQVQNASSVSMFSVDTSSSLVRIGPSAGDTTGTLLVLGNKTDSGDPTVVNGAMYYNSNNGSFRCAEGGVWVNCIGGVITSSTAISSTVSGTGTETPFSNSYNIPAGYCANGRIMHVTAYGLYGTDASASLVLRVKLGSTAVVVSDATAFASSRTSKGWNMTFDIICPSAAGGSATVTAQGLVTFGLETNQQLPYTSSSIATDATQTLSITADWSAGSANNTVSLKSITIQGIGP